MSKDILQGVRVSTAPGDTGNVLIKFRCRHCGAKHRWYWDSVEVTIGDSEGVACVNCGEHADVVFVLDEEET